MGFSEQDVFLEQDGVRIWMGDITLNATATGSASAISVPELSVIYKAMVQCRGTTGHSVTLASGGISGNQIALTYIAGSGLVTSGLDVSGEVVTVIAIGV